MSAKGGTPVAPMGRVSYLGLDSFLPSLRLGAI